MSQFTRTQNVMDDPDEWASAHPSATPDDSHLNPVIRDLITNDLGYAIGEVTEGLNQIDRSLTTATDGWLNDTLDYAAAAETIGWMQDTRRRLATLEAWLAREMQRDPGTPDRIELPDGRVAEVLRGATRKAWDHTAWQHDVRAKVVERVLEGHDDTLVNTATGEPVSLHDCLSAVQAVHGAGAPKVTALKALGLDVGDYCETLPGTISVKISAPETDSPTTVQEN